MLVAVPGCFVKKKNVANKMKTRELNQPPIFFELDYEIKTSDGH